MRIQHGAALQAGVTVHCGVDFAMLRRDGCDVHAIKFILIYADSLGLVYQH